MKEDMRIRLMVAILDRGRGWKAVELFSGYVASVTDKAWQTQLSTQEEWEVWLERIAACSGFISEIRPTTQDKILTLSTCSYEFENARFVVHGILKKCC